VRLGKAVQVCFGRLRCVLLRRGLAVMEWKVTLDMVCLGTAVVVRTGASGQGRLGRGQAVEVWRDWMRPDVAWRGGYGETWSGGVSWVGVRHGMARRLSIFLTRRK